MERIKTSIDTKEENKLMGEIKKVQVLLVGKIKRMRSKLKCEGGK